MIDGLDPGGENLVQPGDVVDRGVGDLDEELIAHGAEESFDLAAAFRTPRPGVDQADPQAGHRPPQLGGHERAAVIQVDRTRHTVAGEPSAKGRLGPQRVLGVDPSIAGEQAGVVVQEREQDRLVTDDDRPVQGVADPQLVGV